MANLTNLTREKLDAIADILDCAALLRRMPSVYIQIDEDDNISCDPQLEKIEALCLAIQETTEKYDLPLLAAYDAIINWQVDEARDGDIVPVGSILKEIEEYIDQLRDDDGELKATEYIINRLSLPDWTEYPTPEELHNALNEYNYSETFATYSDLDAAKEAFNRDYANVEVYARPRHSGEYYTGMAYELLKCESVCYALDSAHYVSTDYEGVQLSAVEDYVINISDDNNSTLIEASPDEVLKYLGTLGDEEKYITMYVNGNKYAESWDVQEIKGYVESMRNQELTMDNNDIIMIRRVLGLTLHQVAEQLGLTPEYINKLENGKVNLSNKATAKYSLLIDSDDFRQAVRKVIELYLMRREQNDTIKG